MWANHCHCCGCTPRLALPPQIAKFMGPTWGPPGSCRPHVGPMLAPWTLLSGSALKPKSHDANLLTVALEVIIMENFPFVRGITSGFLSQRANNVALVFSLMLAWTSCRTKSHIVSYLKCHADTHAMSLWCRVSELISVWHVMSGKWRQLKRNGIEKKNKDNLQQFLLPIIH